MSSLGNLGKEEPTHPADGRLAKLSGDDRYQQLAWSRQPINCWLPAFTCVATLEVISTYGLEEPQKRCLILIYWLLDPIRQQTQLMQRITMNGRFHQKYHSLKIFPFKQAASLIAIWVGVAGDNFRTTLYPGEKGTFSSEGDISAISVLACFKEADY
uniref:Uncharacterized protein n=1 Tax=Timema tahoe TaxID=61484 RepID=A0A7R9IHI2_9NEOP|nr:unnamed protein product [Timema tahoe]